MIHSGCAAITVSVVVSVFGALLLQEIMKAGSKSNKKTFFIFFDLKQKTINNWL